MADQRARAAVCRAYLSGVNAVLAAVEGLSADEEESGTPCPRWTVRDLLTHLWCTAERYHNLLDHAVGGTPQPIVVNEELAALNEAAVRAAPPLPVNTLVRNFHRSAADYLHRALGHWDVAPYLEGSHASVGQICGVAAIEWHVHAWDLAVSQARAYRPDPLDAATMRASWHATVPHLSVDEEGDAWLAVLQAAERRVTPQTVGMPVRASPLSVSWMPWDDASAQDCDRNARSFYQSHAWVSLEDEDPTVEVSVAAFDDRLNPAVVVYAVAEEQSAEYQPHMLAPDVWPGSYLLFGGHRGYLADRLAGESPTSRNVGPLIEAVLNEAVARGHDGALALWATDRFAAELHSSGYAAAPVLLGADTTIHVPRGGFDGYLASLPSKRRIEVRREERQFAESGLVVERHTLAEVWRECVPLLASLQAKYGDSADSQAWAEVLQSMARCLPGSVVFLARFDGQATGFSLAYPFRESLTVRAAGFDYGATPPGAAQYFNLAIHQPVRYAAECGLSKVHLGRDAYAAKVRRGAEVSLLWGVELARQSSARRGKAVRVHEAATLRGLQAQFVGVEQALDTAIQQARRRGWLGTDAGPEGGYDREP
jgi:hypothetical protein